MANNPLDSVMGTLLSIFETIYSKGWHWYIIGGLAIAGAYLLLFT